MKNFTTLFLLISAFGMIGQTAVFKDYNFDDGGYSILGIYSESDRSSLQDSMREFYTDDITILKQFQKQHKKGPNQPVSHMGAVARPTRANGASGQLP